MIAASIDSLLAHGSARWRRARSTQALPTRLIATPVGPIRVHERARERVAQRARASGTDEACVVLVPDGPNVIEHHERLITLLAGQVRVVCFDMPGFGHSIPARSYRHTLDDGARAILGVLDALGIRKATLAFSCANGFYALRAAQHAPDRIAGLVLAQTPSLNAMHAWTDRMIPAPIRVPVLGQAIAWLFRERIAHGWYRAALPKTTEPGPWRKTAKRAFSCGACFCLAGVVQGLMRESEVSLQGVTVPATVVWGEQDRSHAKTDPESVRACLPGAEIIRFADCGHFPDVEAPERFAAIVLERIARQA